MSNPVRIILLAGLIGMLAFAACLGVATVMIHYAFPYPAHYDEIQTNLVWVKRLVSSKLCNLIFIFAAGVAVGLFFKLQKELFLAAFITTLSFQGFSIGYVIFRWGIGYYLKANVPIFTLFVSFSFCVAAAFTTAWLKARLKTKI